jgi:sulfur carrier protein
MIQVSINNDKQTLESGATVQDAIEAIGLADEAMLGVALNMTFVPKDQWLNTRLNDNDQLDVLRPVSGG